MPDRYAAIKAHLRPFFELQSAAGNVIDFYDDAILASTQRDHAQHWPEAAETDQGSSLVQAVAKYVDCSGDRAYLEERIDGLTVLQRLELALAYVRNHKLDARYGLVTGGTTIDWGDVQPESNPGGELTPPSHLSISIYNNAMYLIAIDRFTSLLEPADAARKSWQRLRRSIAMNVRRYLWDGARQKFVPHIYVNGSPFPASFDENEILYEGGTAVAIEAGLLSDAEIRAANEQMLAAQRASGAPSITGSVYPAYPARYFANPIVCAYCYQNGGVWAWFGARMVRELALRGTLEEAYGELVPMLDEVLRDGDFFEWHTLAGQPRGSSGYRAAAGVLWQAITTLQQRAERLHPAMRPALAPRWSYTSLPRGYGWRAQRDTATGDIVYYGVAPSDARAPLAPGVTVYVGPDSVFYYFRHPPPIQPSDLLNTWIP